MSSVEKLMMNEYEIYEISDDEPNYSLCLENLSASDDNHAIVVAKEKYPDRCDVYLVRVIGFIDEL